MFYIHWFIYLDFNTRPEPHLQKVLSCRLPYHTWDLELGTSCEVPTSMPSTAEIAQIWPQVRTWAWDPKNTLLLISGKLHKFDEHLQCLGKFLGIVGPDPRVSSKVQPITWKLRNIIPHRFFWNDGQFTWDVELQPLVSQTKPVHVELAVGSSVRGDPTFNVKSAEWNR